MALVTPIDLAHELGLHQQTVRSRLRECFAARHPHGTRWELTRQESEKFLAWHAGTWRRGRNVGGDRRSPAGVDR